MMRQLQFVLSRRRARQALYRAAERGSPNWQRVDLYDHV